MESLNTRSGPRTRHLPGPRHRPRRSTVRWRIVVSAAAVLMTIAGTAGAVQYQWRDASGRMVFSDQPPPASVSPARILKAPASVAAPAPSTPAAPSTASAASAAPGPSVPPAASAAAASPAASPATSSAADQEFAFRKRMEERAEQEKKAAEQAERQLRLAKACADAQGDIRALESGQRISRINATGEREFLSDAERAQRLSSARKSVSERC